MRKALEKHIKENIKEYFIFALILIIGLFIGTLILNNSGTAQREAISNYLNEFNTQVKDGSRVEYTSMLFEILKKDIVLTGLITFLSVSIIGVPAIYLIIGYKGFSLGYTISAISVTFGTGKGLLFCFSLMFLSKVVEIPAIFFLSLSGIKMYKTIIKDKSKDNVKYAIRKYISNLLIALVMFLISAFIETYISSNLFLSIIKYF